jgi:hypothetical protein
MATPERVEMYKREIRQLHKEVEELKRELFLEGVKNNSNVARVEFLEMKLKEK